MIAGVRTQLAQPGGPSPVKSVLILVAITLLTLVGDTCIKLASGVAGGLRTPVFALGMVLYALPAIGWFFLMRSHSLAAIGVFYSASTLVLLALLGTVAFREPFGLREVLGLTLAALSVVVMSRA